VHNYRNFLRKIQAKIVQEKVNQIEGYADMASVCPLEEEEADYVGPELTYLAAISQLQQPLDSSPDDLDSEASSADSAVIAAASS
jgi:hypothetical protein